MGDDVVVYRGKGVERYAKVARTFQERNRIEVWWYYRQRFGWPGRTNELYLSDRSGVVNSRDVSTDVEILEYPHDEKMFWSRIYRVDRGSWTLLSRPQVYV